MVSPPRPRRHRHRRPRRFRQEQRRAGARAPARLRLRQLGRVLPRGDVVRARTRDRPEGPGRRGRGISRQRGRLRLARRTVVHRIRRGRPRARSCSRPASTRTSRRSPACRKRAPCSPSAAAGVRRRCATWSWKAATSAPPCSRKHAVQVLHRRLAGGARPAPRRADRRGPGRPRAPAITSTSHRRTSPLVIAEDASTCGGQLGRLTIDGVVGEIIGRLKAQETARRLRLAVA